MKKSLLFVFLNFTLLAAISGQRQTTDTLKDQSIRTVTIKGWKDTFSPTAPLPDVHQSYITAGKSSQIIDIDKTPANTVEKTVRQVFAKIPGAFAYDMDGSGTQINLALRGLDPHRSWDMNVRQNGVMLNSDLYGYPASHYNPPLESVDRIELVRGTASLQYGAMFGGMLNYVTKQPDSMRNFTFENQSGAGSFGLLSTYNALGGRHGKVTWQTYFYRRSSEGYRDNGASTSEAHFASVAWQISPTLQLKAELGHSKYLYQIPGPLTDSMFREDPRQATRSRNYYSPDIWVPSLTLDGKIGPKTHFSWIVSHLRGDRNSVQFLGAADKVDAINPQTLQYTNRQVDIDHFNSSTTEARIAHYYQIGKLNAVLAGGFRLIYNDLNRLQIGKGTTGSDFDLTLLDPNWGRDLHYKTKNAAVFVENLLYISSKFSISPGFRIERGLTEMTGVIRALAPDRVPTDIEHQFALFGCSFQYKPASQIRIYGGISQAYRPVILGEVIPANSLEQVDPNLKDSRGYNAELGLQGQFFENRLHVNATLFQLQYNDRIGQQAFEDANNNVYYLKTNIGDSRTNGVEFYAEGVLYKTTESILSIFTATAYMDGRYVTGSLASGTENKELSGNRLESVPQWTSRSGLQAGWRIWNLALQYSYVGETYSDPFNTKTPVANGTRGIVPAYSLLDAHLSVAITPSLRIRISGNNLADKQYFTKRPSIYPGPGVWSSDGRSFVGTLMFTLGWD